MNCARPFVPAIAIFIMFGFGMLISQSTPAPWSLYMPATTGEERNRKIKIKLQGGRRGSRLLGRKVRDVPVPSRTTDGWSRGLDASVIWQRRAAEHRNKRKECSWYACQSCIAWETVKWSWSTPQSPIPAHDTEIHTGPRALTATNKRKKLGGTPQNKRSQWIWIAEDARKNAGEQSGGWYSRGPFRQPYTTSLKRPYTTSQLRLTRL